MARPVRVMRWDDPGAPQRSPANAASIVDILKKCLVDGYGDTDPLGWTLEYADAPGAIAVFRNSPVSGSGGYFRISPYNIPTNAYIRTQSAMAATGPNQEDLFAPGYLNSVPTESALTRWILIGDDRSFYFLLHHATVDFVSANMSVCLFFGDYDAVIPTDVSKFICTGANVNSTTSTAAVNFTALNTGPISAVAGRANIIWQTFGGDTTRARIGVPASVSGTMGIANYILYAPGEIAESSLLNASNTSYPVGGLVQRVSLKLDAAITNARLVDPDYPFLRGHLPGLITLGLKTHYNATWPVLMEIDDISYLGVALNSNASVYGGIMLWINTENWE
ncbi:hypothetical protein [Rheinheimera gaetbuli]